MKKFFFLPSEISFLLFGIVLLCLVRLTFEQAIFILTFIGGVAFAFRRSNIPYVDTARSEGEIFVSPIHGTVESIRQNVQVLDDSEIGHEVRISMSIWDEKGLYLPTAGEVSYLKANKGKRVPRDSEDHAFYGALEDVAHTDLIFSSKNKVSTLLRFVDGEYCLRPSIWLKSGDRGRGGACFGYYPFGGTLLIYLPKNSDVLVYESERVKPGKTVIAAIKEVK